MFLVSSSVTKTMAEDVEGFVLKLSELALGFIFKREQELSMRYLFNCIDVMAVLPTEFRVIFVMMCGVQTKKKTKNRLFEYHRDFSISKHHTRSSNWLK